MESLNAIEHLPQTGWGVVALMLVGMFYIIVLLIRGIQNQKAINHAVNGREKGEPTLVKMVAEMHSNHYRFRRDIDTIKNEVADVRRWQASYDGSELSSGAGVANFVREVRDGIAECKKHIQNYGCPVRLELEPGCLKGNAVRDFHRHPVTSDHSK